MQKLLVSFFLAAAMTTATDAGAVLRPLMISGDVAVDLTQFCEYLEDPEGTLAIADVAGTGSADRFRPLDSTGQSFGVTRSTVWVRFSVAAADSEATSHRWFLSLDWPFNSLVQCYIADKDAPGGWRMVETGPVHQGERSRTLNNFFIYQLPFLGPEPLACYVRAQSYTALMVPLRILHPLDAIQKSNRFSFGYGVYYGIVLFIALLNLFLYQRQKDRRFLWYILYVLSVGGFFLLSNRIVQAVVPQYRYADLIRLHVFFAVMFTFWGTLFTRSFLRTRHAARPLDRVLLGVMAIAVLFAILTPVFELHLLVQFVSSFGFVMVFIVTAVGAIRWRQGFRPARFYLVGFSIFGLGGFVHALLIHGLLPYHPLFANAFQMASAFEIMILQVALAEWIALIHRDKERAEAETRRANERLLEYNLTLEQKVRERTRELETMNSELEILIETTPDAILLVDPDGRIVAANRRAARLFGYGGGGGEVLVDSAIADLAAPEDRQRILNSLTGIRETLEPMTLEFTAHDRHGDSFPVEMNAAAVPSDTGAVTRVIAVIRDISPRRRAEREQLDRVKMNIVLQTAGAACHEINQPLQEIIGLIDIIQLQHEDTEIAGKLTQIKHAVERLAGIVRKLNSIARYETKQYGEGTTIIDLDRASLSAYPPQNPGSAHQPENFPSE